MPRFRSVWRLVALGAWAGSAECAWAQRVAENALASAQDAFGTTVGNESVGLYTPRDVRGFDPVQAGNVRLEGLYFDRQNPNPQEIFIGSLVSGSTMRVGLSAQSYLFPAPTGIADVKLRIPGEKLVTSVVGTAGFYTKYALDVSTQVPIIKDRLSVHLATGNYSDDTPDGGNPHHILGAFVGHWRPAEAIEVIPFWSRKESTDLLPRPNVYTAGAFLPPEVPRHALYVQPWARNAVSDSNFGVITNAALSDAWLLRAGLFRSIVVRHAQWNTIYQNTQPDGTADSIAVKFPPQKYGSVSGEIRASGTLSAGDWRHTVHVAFRGRIVDKELGGSDAKNLGKMRVGFFQAAPEPQFTLGRTNADHVDQGTGGIAYEARWLGFGEFSAGLQKTYYRRRLTSAAGVPTVSSDSPFLPNATLAVHPTGQLTVFGSYTRGMEESADAPSNATNRGEALPAIRTKQVDAGARYAFTPNLSGVITVFEVQKPYLNLNNVNLFTHVGQVRHRGIEVSLAGTVAEGLTIVAGSVFLQARVSGELVDSGLLGPVPVGRIPRSSRLEIEYAPPSWLGASVDTQIEHRSSRVASVNNQARIPARGTISIGGRYRFDVFGAPASLRGQIKNITNTFGWDVNPMQLAFQTEEKRRYALTFAVDF